MKRTKRLLLISFICFMISVLSASLLFATEGFDCEPGNFFSELLNKCQPEYTEKQHKFDYGLYLHLILWESDNWEIGNLNMWEVQREEGTFLLGGKWYINRFWQKDE